jgi:hypothetical protein
VSPESPPGPHEWERTQAFEFSRHYDNLVWVVTSLLTTANAALMAIAGDAVSIQVGIFGMMLSVLTVFFAASFRVLRRRVHERLENRLSTHAEWLYSGLVGFGAQWLVYVLFFAGIAGLWTSLLLSRFPKVCGVWWAMLGAASAAMTGLYLVGRRRRPDRVMRSKRTGRAG